MYKNKEAEIKERRAEMGQGFRVRTLFNPADENRGDCFFNTADNKTILTEKKKWRIDEDEILT